VNDVISSNTQGSIKADGGRWLRLDKSLADMHTWRIRSPKHGQTS